MIYTEMDRLVLERWTDIRGLIEAQEDVQDRMEEMIRVVGERLVRWILPHGYLLEAISRKGEFHLWRPAWVDRRKGHKVSLALGGFCPIGFRKVEDRYPYLWLYTSRLEEFKVKEAQRREFAQSVRTALGERASRWESPDSDDAEAPFGRYLPDYDEAARAQLLLQPDALFEFATRHIPELFELADPVEAELEKLGR
jgi:hypothetical protein